MAASDVELLRRAWEAFARGDLDGATDVLDPGVRWYGADGKVTEMVVYPTVDEALVAAGLTLA